MENLNHINSVADTSEIVFKSINQCIDFNESINKSQNLTQRLLKNKDFQNKHLTIIREPLKHWEYRRLRKIIFKEMDYTEEFSSTLENYDFDTFDSNTINLGIEDELENLIGGMRLILDTPDIKLQSDKKYSFDKLREKGYSLAEMSRLVIEQNHRSRKNSLDLITATYKIGLDIGINYFIFGILNKHLKFYESLAETETLYSGNYGNIHKDCIIVKSDLNRPKKILEKRLENIQLNEIQTPSQNFISKIQSIGYSGVSA